MLVPASQWSKRMWTNDLTYKLLEKVQLRKAMLLDPKLRRRMVYADVAVEFQVCTRDVAGHFLV